MEVQGRSLQMFRVMLRSSHCWERELEQSLRVGICLSSSEGMSRHWLLFTCSKVNRCETHTETTHTHTFVSL